MTFATMIRGFLDELRIERGASRNTLDAYGRDLATLGVFLGERGISDPTCVTTGDLVELDADGFVTFKGRLKRFVKAGGEMVSLPALEEPFSQAFPPNDDGPRVAVEGVELGSKAKVVLFTTEPITQKEANALLQAR